MSDQSARPASRSWLLAAFLFSGAAALMLEVVWSRKLHLLFGGSAVATSAVLAAYMGGLALGSIVLAPRVRRRFHPALAYGLMEIVVAIYALAVPWMVESVGGFLNSMPDAGGSDLVGAAVRFVLSGAVLLVPTALMGATLPCLADLAGDTTDGAAGVGVLYAANTLGAVGGTLLATFVMFPAFGVDRTNLVAAGVDALVGAGACIWWLRNGRPAPLARPDIVSGRVGGASMAPLIAYGFSGAMALALEVLWTRALSMVLGSSIHAFSLMLASFLFGLAVGARIAAGAWTASYEPRRLLALVLGFTGSVAFLGTMLIDRLPEVVFFAARSQNLDEWTMWTAMLVCSAAVMLPAAVGFGAVLPCALRAASATARVENLGDLVGKAYAINTAGAIIGATVAGLVIPPQLGVDRGAQALCVLLLGAAALLVARTRIRLAGAMCLAAALMGTWQGFDVGRWTAGAFRVYLARTVWGEELPEANVIFRRDGLSTTVTMEEYNGRISLKVNGKVDASSEGDMPTQVLSGLLPILMHPDPKRGAIVGFGSGVTSDAALSYQPLQQLEMVELEPAVVEAGEFFAPVNHRPWEDPRYVGVFDDGRNHLSRPGAPYDFIISEPSNPWITGASSLFTREFWTLARSRLNDGGVFLQWVQLYELSTDRIRSLMGTFASVFPHVMVFAAHPNSNDTLMIGSTRPLVIDEALLRARWAQPTVRQNLKRADLHDPIDLMALLLMDGDGLRAFTAGATINTDDNMFVELNAPRDLVAYSQKEPELPFMGPLAGKRAPLLERNTRFMPGRQGPDLHLALAEMMFRSGLIEDAQSYAAQLVGMGEPYESRRERLIEAIDVLNGDDEVAVVDADAVRSGDQRYIRVVQAMLDGQDGKALELFEAFPKLEEASPAHRMLLAYLHYRADNRWRSKQLMEPLLHNHAWRRVNPEATYYGARILWLADENQRAARLALEYVDHQIAAREAKVKQVLGE